MELWKRTSSIFKIIKTYIVFFTTKFWSSQIQKQETKLNYKESQRFEKLKQQCQSKTKAERYQNTREQQLSRDCNFLLKSKKTQNNEDPNHTRIGLCLMGKNQIDICIKKKRFGVLNEPGDTR